MFLFVTCSQQAPSCRSTESVLGRAGLQEAGMQMHVPVHTLAVSFILHTLTVRSILQVC